MEQEAVNALLSPVVQIGALGLCALLVFLLAYVMKLLAQMVKDHRESIDRNTAAWAENTRALTKLAENMPHVCRAKERIPT